MAESKEKKRIFDRIANRIKHNAGGDVVKRATDEKADKANDKKNVRTVGDAADKGVGGKIGRSINKKENEESSGGNTVVDMRGKAPRKKREKPEKEKREKRESVLKKELDRIEVNAKHSLVVIEAEGHNHARALNLLSRETTVKVLYEKGALIRFCVPSRHKSKIIAILDDLCYSYKIISARGPVPLAIGALRRVGILLGLLAAVCVLVIYPHFVLDIEISGYVQNQGLQGGELNESVLDILSEYGVRQGALLWNFDDKSVKARLLQLDGVAYASVHKAGTRVYVTVKPELAKDGYIGISTSNVTAKMRATVTRVVVYSGTGLVKYGDIVQKGDPLIGNYVVVGETQVASPASGEVYGKIYHTKTLFFADSEIVMAEGEVKKITRVSFFGSKVKEPKAPFELFRLEKQEWKSGFLVPYTTHTWIYTSLVPTERVNARTDDEMKKIVRASLFEGLDVNATVLDEWSEMRGADGGVYVKYIIETEERIS